MAGAVLQKAIIPKKSAPLQVTVVIYREPCRLLPHKKYIAIKRIKEIFSDIFNAPISEGGMHYVLDRLVLKAQPA